MVRTCASVGAHLEYRPVNSHICILSFLGFRLQDSAWVIFYHAEWSRPCRRALKVFKDACWECSLETSSNSTRAVHFGLIEVGPGGREQVIADGAGRGVSAPAAAQARTPADTHSAMRVPPPRIHRAAPTDHIPRAEIPTLTRRHIHAHNTHTHTHTIAHTHH